MVVRTLLQVIIHLCYLIIPVGGASLFRRFELNFQFFHLDSLHHTSFFQLCITWFERYILLLLFLYLTPHRNVLELE